MGWDDDFFNEFTMNEEPQEPEHDCDNCSASLVCPLQHAKDYRKAKGLPEPPTLLLKLLKEACRDQGHEWSQEAEDELQRRLTEERVALVPQGHGELSENQLRALKYIRENGSAPAPPPLEQGPQDHHLFVSDHSWHLTALEIKLIRSQVIASITCSLKDGQPVKAGLAYGASLTRNMIRDRDQRFSSQLKIFQELGVMPEILADAMKQAELEKARGEKPIFSSIMHN